MQDELNNFSVGLSGCSFEFTSSGNLRKSASDDYSYRLKIQAQKQRLFSSFAFHGISTPKIYSIEDKYFDMEYIPGITMREFLSMESIGDINHFILCLHDYFISLFDMCTQTYDLNEFINIVHNKLDTFNTTQYKSLIDKLRIYTDTLKFISLPRGLCHGDLTLENIIFYKNRFYYIDFLDSFITSPVIDLIKLKQDLYYGWFLKNVTDTSYMVRTLQACSYIWKMLYHTYKNIINSQEFYILDAINYLRIEPYIKSAADAHHLSTILYKIEHNVIFNNSGN